MTWGVLTKKGPNTFVEDTEKNATWWNSCKCTRKPKVIYTTQHNCFYYPKGWRLPLYNEKDATDTLIINCLRLDPYRFTHFSVTENRRLFLPVKVRINVTKISEVPLRDVMVVHIRHCAHNLLNIASPYSSLRIQPGVRECQCCHVTRGATNVLMYSTFSH